MIDDLKDFSEKKFSNFFCCTIFLVNTVYYLMKMENNNIKMDLIGIYEDLMKMFP